MLGSNSHIVLYPINKKKNLIWCIMRCKNYEPDNVKQLVQEILLKQNPKLKIYLRMKSKHSLYILLQKLFLPLIKRYFILERF